MERRDEECKHTPQTHYDDKCIYITLAITINLLFGSLFYYYALNTTNDECHQLRSTSFYYALYCTISIILSLITTIGQKTFDAIATIEGVCRLLFLIAFFVALMYSNKCSHLQSLTFIFLSLHTLVFIVACMKSQINKTKQL